MRFSAAATAFLLSFLASCNGFTVFFQDAGASGEDMCIISAEAPTQTFGNSAMPQISNTTTPMHFCTHRWGSNFSYTISGLKPDFSYIVSVGFAEIYEPNCGKGNRLMDVTINGEVRTQNLDVYAAAGCRTALTKPHITNATTTGTINVGFIAKKQNAMVSCIEVIEDDIGDTKSNQGEGETIEHTNSTGKIGLLWIE